MMVKTYAVCNCFSQFRTDGPFAALRAPPGAAALSWQLPFALLPVPSPSLGEQPIRVEEAGDNGSKHIICHISFLTNNKVCK